MLRLVVLSTLLVATANAAVEDRLQFFFRFTCQPAGPAIKSWEHRVELWEYDVITNDENWHVPHGYASAKVGLNNTLVYFNILSAGDQWFSAGYEPYLYISHSCTDDGRIVYVTLWPSKLIPIGAHETSVHVNYDLTNKEGSRDPNGNFYYYDSTKLTHEKYGATKDYLSFES